MTVRKLLIDGFVEAEWTLGNCAGTSTLTVQPYRALSDDEEAAVADEGARLLGLVAPEDVHEPCFKPPASPDY